MQHRGELTFAWYKVSYLYPLSKVLKYQEFYK